jgi:hypothetical protein
MALTKLDLPDPTFPTTATNFPRGTEIEISFNVVLLLSQANEACSMCKADSRRKKPILLAVKLLTAAERT